MCADEVGGSSIRALVAAEGDHGDLVAALVGVAQQGQRGTADGGHPVAGGHRAGGVDDEDHQVALAALADGPAQVVGLQAQRPGPVRRACGGGQQVANRCRPCAPGRRARVGGGRPTPPACIAGPRPSAGRAFADARARASARVRKLSPAGRARRRRSGASADSKPVAALDRRRSSPPSGGSWIRRSGPDSGSGSGPGRRRRRWRQRLVELRRARCRDRRRGRGGDGAAAPARPPPGRPPRATVCAPRQAAWAARCAPPPGRRACRRRRTPRTAPRSGAARCRAAPLVDQRAGGGDPARPGRASCVGVPRPRTRPGRLRRPAAGGSPRTRTSTSREACTSTVSPNRSSSCGRSSPSSGFMVPTSTNRASWECETPSRSMCTRPIAAASSRMSTRWSCSRLTSST